MQKGKWLGSGWDGAHEKTGLGAAGAACGFFFLRETQKLLSPGRFTGSLALQHLPSRLQAKTLTRAPQPAGARCVCCGQPVLTPGGGRSSIPARRDRGDHSGTLAPTHTRVGKAEQRVPACLAGRGARGAGVPWVPGEGRRAAGVVVPRFGSFSVLLWGCSYEGKEVKRVVGKVRSDRLRVGPLLAVTPGCRSSGFRRRGAGSRLPRSPSFPNFPFHAPLSPLEQSSSPRSLTGLAPSRQGLPKASPPAAPDRPQRSAGSSQRSRRGPGAGKAVERVVEGHGGDTGGRRCPLPPPPGISAGGTAVGEVGRGLLVERASVIAVN